jgi:hypothetical protein
LDSLSFIRHFLVQIATLLTADCSFLVEISTVSPTTMTAVSSANVAMVLFDVSTKDGTKFRRQVAVAQSV